MSWEPKRLLSLALLCSAGCHLSYTVVDLPREDPARPQAMASTALVLECRPGNDETVSLSAQFRVPAPTDIRVTTGKRVEYGIKDSWTAQMWEVARENPGMSAFLTVATLGMVLIYPLLGLMFDALVFLPSVPIVLAVAPSSSTETHVETRPTWRCHRLALVDPKTGARLELGDQPPEGYVLRADHIARAGLKSGLLDAEAEGLKTRLELPAKFALALTSDEQAAREKAARAQAAREQEQAAARELAARREREQAVRARPVESPRPVAPPPAPLRPAPRSPPQVTLAGLRPSTSEESVVISVTATDDGAGVKVTIKINDVEVHSERGVGRNGHFHFDVSVPLKLGKNRIEVSARNAAGDPASVSEWIERVEAAPRCRTLALLVSPGSATEARDVAAVLGATDENVKVVAGDQVTREGVVAGLRELGARAGLGDRLVVFLTGAGLVGKEPPDGSKPPRYFVTRDADRSPSKLQTTALPVSEIGQVLGASKAGEVVVFLDASFAGDLGATRDALARELVSRRGQAVLGALHGPRGASPDLAALVLDGLKGAADANKDGTIDSDELCRFIGERCGKLEGCLGFGHEQTDGPIKLLRAR